MSDTGRRSELNDMLRWLHRQFALTGAVGIGFVAGVFYLAVHLAGQGAAQSATQSELARIHVGIGCASLALTALMSLTWWGYRRCRIELNLVNHHLDLLVRIEQAHAKEKKALSLSYTNVVNKLREVTQSLEQMSLGDAAAGDAGEKPGRPVPRLRDAEASGGPGAVGDGSRSEHLAQRSVQT
jgi:hypothetical protein